MHYVHKLRRSWSCSCKESCPIPHLEIFIIIIFCNPEGTAFNRWFANHIRSPKLNKVRTHLTLALACVQVAGHGTYTLSTRKV